MSDEPYRYLSLEHPIALSKDVQIFIAPAGSGPIMTFHADGRVTADPNLKPDEAARKIIALLVEGGWFKFLPT